MKTTSATAAAALASAAGFAALRGAHKVENSQEAKKLPRISLTVTLFEENTVQLFCVFLIE
jgi:hypothetical protein